MPTMFRTTKRDTKIEAREVTKATASMVMFPGTYFGNPKENREQRMTDWHQWHDTWEDAHTFLMEQAERRVKSLRLELERANGALGNIKGMKKPA